MLLGAGGLHAQEVRSASAADSLLATLLPAPVRTAIVSASPALVVRRAEVAAAEARRAAVGFAPAAVLGFESEESRNGRLDRGNTRVDLSREFLSGARRRSEREAAEADVRVARVALVIEERRALAAAARALYGAAGWRGITRRLAAQDSLLASAEVSVRARFSVGESRYVDVLRLRTERLRVQTDRATAETEAEAAAIALVAIVGGDSAAIRAASDAIDSADASGVRRSGARVVPVVLTLRLPEAPPIDSLVGLAADVQLAEARIAQARAQRQLILARQRPAFSASLGLQRIGPEGDEGAAFGPVISAGMTLPFTVARANRAGLAAAEQQTAVALAARAATVTSVRGAVAAARARYEAARRRAATFDATLLQAAREERESALAAYRTTDISLLELLDFERALARAEIERTQATLDALTALAELLSGAPSPVTASSLSTTQAETGTGRATDDQ
ncbi:MAG: TolC family protein [Gemmatimonadaceae bacterium]|nr:TolC family protein [Gemmatimonadaceae bacterium]